MDRGGSPRPRTERPGPAQSLRRRCLHDGAGHGRQQGCLRVHPWRHAPGIVIGRRLELLRDAHRRGICAGARAAPALHHPDHWSAPRDVARHCNADHHEDQLMNAYLSPMIRYWRRPQLADRSTRTDRKTACRRRLCLECLEHRRLLTAVAAPSGLVSWWTANGTANDVTGLNNATLSSGVSYAPGEVGQAFSFNTSDYASATTTDMPTGEGDRTMEMWVKLNSIPTSGEAFFAGYGNFGTADETYQLGTSGSNLFWSQWGNQITGPSLSANVWYHIAVTNIGNTATLYLDGAAVGTSTLTVNTPANASFYVGRIPGALGNTRAGRPGGRGLRLRPSSSPLEIQAIYEAGSDGKIMSPISVDFPSVVQGPAGTTTPVTFTVTRNGSLSAADRELGDGRRHGYRGHRL